MFNGVNASPLLYSSSTTYPLNTVVISSVGLYWQSLQAGNINQTLAENAWWTRAWHELEKRSDGGAVGLHTAVTISYTEMDRYVSAPLATTVLPEGIWSFELFSKVTGTNKTGQIKATIYRISSTGAILATLGVAESQAFSNTTVSAIDAEIFISSQTGWNLTDRIGVIISGKSSATMTWYHDITQGWVSIMNTPIVTLHNQLAGLNEGDYIHLTSIEKTNISSAISNSHTHTNSTILASIQEMFSANTLRNFMLNIMLNSFRIAQQGSLTLLKMVDGFMDEYESEAGIDTANSTNEIYNSTDDYYSPNQTSGLEIDYMEYSSDGTAQTAYVRSDSASFNVLSEATIKTQGNYSLKGTASSNVSFDSYTKLLLHLDNNVVDSEITPKTVTNNNVTFSSSSKFGSHAASFNGSNAYLSVPDSDDFAFGSGDFTIDTWVRFNDVSAFQLICGQMPSDPNYWVFTYYTNSFKRLHFEGYTQDANFIQLDAAFSPEINTWYHIALVRYGSSVTIYVNGISIGSLTSTKALYNYTGDLTIGAWSGVYGTMYFFNGDLDEFRISKGIARWTSNFTPPTTAYSYNSGGSLDQTLTKTLSPTIDLSSAENIYFDIRASRTGAHIKVGIYEGANMRSEITPTIAVADTFQTVTWDISAVNDADKNAIDKIIITIINADATNTFYIDNFIVVGQKFNMSLCSNAQTAEAVPTSIRVILFEEDVDAITINTDLKAYVSRNGGTTYSQATLSDAGNYISGAQILTGEADVSGQSSGTDIKYKVETLNEKSLKLHGTAISWK
jgi:hypothetical protein